MGGMVRLSTYLIKYKVGDYVDIKCNPAVHKGMPFKGYHGRTGIVFNVTKRALGVRVNKLVNGRILNKMIHVRVEHVRPSKCRQEVIGRVKENEGRRRRRRSRARRSTSSATPSSPRRATCTR